MAYLNCYYSLFKLWPRWNLSSGQRFRYWSLMVVIIVTLRIHWYLNLFFNIELRHAIYYTDYFSCVLMHKEAQRQNKYTHLLNKETLSEGMAARFARYTILVNYHMHSADHKWAATSFLEPLREMHVWLIPRKATMYTTCMNKPGFSVDVKSTE